MLRSGWFLLQLDIFGKCKSSTVVREHLEKEMLLSLNAMRLNASALLVFNL